MSAHSGKFFFFFDFSSSESSSSSLSVGISSSWMLSPLGKTGDDLEGPAMPCLDGRGVLCDAGGGLGASANGILPLVYLAMSRGCPARFVWLWYWYC